MCLETMDTGSKHLKTDCPRKVTKPGSKLRWRPPRVSPEDDEALKRCRAGAVKMATRKCLHREQRRAQLAKLSRLLGDMGKKGPRASPCEERPAAAYDHRHPPGAMAPENTTQYLMSNVYDDMKENAVRTVPVQHGTCVNLYVDSLSPRSVYTALDSGYESCLAFQQTDFEETFGLCW